VSRPDPERSRVILVGTSKYADERLPDLPAVGKTIADLGAVLTHPDYRLVSPDHCTELVDEGDIRELGRRLAAAEAVAGTTDTGSGLLTDDTAVTQQGSYFPTQDFPAQGPATQQDPFPPVTNPYPPTEQQNPFPR